MGYTYEQLQKMGATPVEPKRGLTLDELKKMGAKEYKAPEPIPEPTLKQNVKSFLKELPGAAKTVAQAPFKQPLKTAQAVTAGFGDIGVSLANLGLKVGGSTTRLPYLTEALAEAQTNEKDSDLMTAIGTGSKMFSGYTLGKAGVGKLGVTNPIAQSVLGDVVGGQAVADVDMSMKERGKQALFDLLFSTVTDIVPAGIRGALKKKPAVDIPTVKPKVEEPKNLIEVGDKKFKVSDEDFNTFKRQEQSTLSKLDNLEKQIQREDIDQQKLDYFSSQIRLEKSRLDKLKRDLTGNYTASELKSLVNKERKEFAKQGLRDVRTDEQIIDKITSKKVEFNPDETIQAPNTVRPDEPIQYKQDIPIQKAKASGQSFDEWVKGKTRNFGLPTRDVADNIYKEIYKNEKPVMFQVSKLNPTETQGTRKLLGLEKFTEKQAGKAIDNPIIITEKGTILDGHNRYYQALANGDKEIPTFILKDKEVYRSQLKAEWDKIQQAIPTQPKRFEHAKITDKETVFKERLQNNGEDYVRDVASKRIEDPDLPPEIAYKQLEMKYDIEGNKEKLFELHQEATGVTSSQAGQNLGFLNTAEASYGPLGTLQRAQNVLDAKLKRMKIDIDPEVTKGMDDVLRDINNGKSFKESIDNFIDGLTCK